MHNLFNSLLLAAVTVIPTPNPNSTPIPKPAIVSSPTPAQATEYKTKQLIWYYDNVCRSSGFGPLWYAEPAQGLPFVDTIHCEKQTLYIHWTTTP